MGLLDFDYKTYEKMSKINRYCESLGDCSTKCKIYDICTSLEAGSPIIPPGMLDEAFDKVKDLVIE